MIPALVTLSRAPVVLRSAPAVLSVISGVAGRTFGSVKSAWNWVSNNPIKSAAVFTGVSAIPDVADYLQSGDGAKIIEQVRGSFSEESVDRLVDKLPGWSAARSAALDVVEKDADAPAVNLEEAARIDVYENVARRIAARFHARSFEALVSLRQDVAMMIEMPAASWAYVSKRATSWM